MAIEFKKKTLLAAVQATLGVAAELTAADAVETSNLSIDLYQGDSLSKEVDRASEGNYAEIKTGLNTALSGDVYIAGSGTAGMAPAYGPLLTAAGFGEEIEPGVAATYRLQNGQYAMVTLGYMRLNEAGKMQLHVADSARATMSLSIKEKELPKLTFTMTGLYNDPTELDALAPDTSDYRDPVPVNAANTPKISLGGRLLEYSEFTLETGGTITVKDRPGGKEVILNQMKPKGKLVFFPADSLADQNWLAESRSDNGINTQSLIATHGGTAGNIFTVEGVVQLTNLAETEVDGRLAYSTDLIFLPSDGLPGLTLTVK
ncbi:hypothetical protein ACKC9G_18455 [Pokkaliibacter sp. CJK22405]|uniref:hypothetical protein n=1 Tax=Pokkaliibacter sp. CJK22405 TaxID=3384615 RepID=UPI003984CB38